MEAQSLVALDTDHIKGYVFSTNTLKEIRGASSLLDRLNRDVMRDVMRGLMRDVMKELYDVDWRIIYANGGSGLFLIDADKAVEFGTRVQDEYRWLTAGGASITFVVQPLPEDAPHNTIDEIMKHPMPHTLALLRYRLREQKDNPHIYTTEVSHPLMRHCDSCGIFYAVKYTSREQDFYCQCCLNKQKEDSNVKDYITAWVGPQSSPSDNFKSPLWDNILNRLQQGGYQWPSGTDRPEDLNVFGEFRQAKDYLGLIYADANGMGRKIEKLQTLEQTQAFAKKIDDAVYRAMCDAIREHLPAKQVNQSSVFPFDILLIGGDDLVIVTSAAQAMPVAWTLAKQFYRFANEDVQQEGVESVGTTAQESIEKEEKNSLSVGVVLAPTNYPFSLMLKLVEDTLKFAKKDGAKSAKKKSDYGKTRINFLVVAGNTGQSFATVHKLWHRKEKNTNNSFAATMRPYTLEQFEFLLKMLSEGSQRALGRSKLHQLREAILYLNLSTSVTESLAVLRSWKAEQRNFVVKKVYSTEQQYPLIQWDEENPAANFPVVTFPWLVDNKEKGVKQYSTFLLDFVELYDFAAREDGA